MAQEIKIRITLDGGKEVVATARVTDAEFKKMGGTIEETGQKTSRLGKIFDFSLGQLAANAVQKLASGVVNLARRGFQFLEDSLGKARVQQIADRKLEQAIRLTGEATEKWLPLLKEAARQLQGTSVQGDEMTQTAQALLLGFKAAAGPQGVALLTRNLGDLEAALAGAGGEGGDLTSIARAIGRTLEGSTEALSRYGVVLSDVEKKQLLAAQGMDRVRMLSEILDKRFGGLAKATADPVIQMQNALGDLQEEFAFGFLPVVNDIAREVTDLSGEEGVRGLAREIGEKLGGALRTMFNIIKENRDDFEEFVDDFVRLAEGALQLVAQGDDLADWLNSVNERTATLGDQLGEALAKIVPPLQSIRDLAAELREGEEGVGDLGLPGPEEFSRVVDVAEVMADIERRRSEAQRRQRDQEQRLTAEQLAALRERAFTRRRLEIELMEEGNARRLAMIDLALDQEKARYAEKFPELLDLIEQQREKLRAEVLRVPFTIELKEPLDEVLDDDLDLSDIRLALDGSIVAIEDNLAHLQEMFDEATTDEARKEIQAFIDKLEELRAKAEDTQRGMIDLGGEIAGSLRAAIGGLAEDVGLLIAGNTQLDRSIRQVDDRLADLHARYEEASTEKEREEIRALIAEQQRIKRELSDLNDLQSTIGRAILQTIGDLAVRVGESMIAFGVAGLALKTFLSNPVAAIVAGAALVALGTALNAHVQRQLDEATRGGGGAAGGAVPGPQAEGIAPRRIGTIIRLPARERGGPVGAGEAVIVGEAGPEVFVPRTGGAIHPDVMEYMLGAGARAMAERQASGPPPPQIVEVPYVAEVVPVGLHELGVRLRRQEQHIRKMLGESPL